jgi:hypothetical protein
MPYEFDAYVTAVCFDAAHKALFALGDGTVRSEGGDAWTAHGGAILAAALHPSGEGLVTGGDDGRLAWTRGGDVQDLANLPGKWIDVVAASPASGLIAFAAGRDLFVRGGSPRRPTAGLGCGTPGSRGRSPSGWTGPAATSPAPGARTASS